MADLNPFEGTPTTDWDPSTQDFWDYSDLVESFSPGVNWFEYSFGTYQGDNWYIGTKGGEEVIYFLCVGYGSCSYCDALQDCGGPADLIELRDNLRLQVRSFKDAEEFKEYIRTDAAGSWFYYREEWPDFLKQVKNTYGWDLPILKEEE